MSQFELIEDYLTNRLDGGAREAFEQKMQGDPQLKAEVELQNSIIEGVKSARVAELKAMLNNVPIGGATSGALAGKIAVATISAVIVGTALYFGLRTTTADQLQPEQSIIEESLTPIVEPEQNESVGLIDESTKEETKTPIKSSGKENNSSKSVSPKIDVMDLSQDMEENSKNTSVSKLANKPTISTSTVEVETNNTNKSYSFHYQFKTDKLVLYGPFDASLYEIIEINGGSHHVFLYYKKSYYHLDELEQQISPLIMIRDFELLGKLEEFRNKK